jgi:putative ABC transport system permease protein
MTSLVHDIRYSIRALAKSPLLTGAVLLVLALGIGMNSALFSVVNTVLLAPTSNYTDHPERALVVFGKDPQGRRKTIAYPDYQEVRAQCDACEQLAAYQWQPITVTGFKDPFRVGGLATSANYFAAIGWKPLLGRVYTAAEDRVAGSGVAVLNYQIWQKRFGVPWTDGAGTP